MTYESKIGGFTGTDIMSQTEFLRTAVEMMVFLDDQMSETNRSEIRRGVRFFLIHCIDAKLENVNAAAVEHYLQHLLNERVSKTTFFHLFSVLQRFFHWADMTEQVFPNICAGIVPAYRVKKLRRIKRGRGGGNG